MALKPGPSLRELMKGRNKAPSPQEANKSKPPVNPPPSPPQLPADLGLKLIPELRRKRHQEASKEGEVGPPKGSKQQRQSQDQRSRRSDSVDSQEELPVAQVRRPTRIWSPKLEVDSVPIAWDSSIRHYRGGHAGMSPRPWSSPSSSQKTWRPTGTSANRSSFYPLRGIWSW